MSQDEEQLVAVSPRHSVRLRAEYALWVRQAPRQDFVVRTILKREANGLPLISADIVIAGEDTRAAFPLAAQYPLHFRKTYYPGRLHGDPRQERDRQNEAAAVLNAPPAIGATHQTFRSCLLPGMPYQRLSPFGVEPEEANLPLARDLGLATAAGLWRLLEDAFQSLRCLHDAGIVHGDLERHNMIVCPNPLEIVLIDYEVAIKRGELDDAEFLKRLDGDYLPMLREAALLQCCLGEQRGPLAEMSMQKLPNLFKRPDVFHDEILQRTSRPA